MVLGTGDKIRESLKNKSNKKHIKALEKPGNLEFQRVGRLADIGADWDEIIALYDFRQGALHGCMPFRADPLKQEFFSRLSDVPGILHSTVWRQGRQDHLRAHRLSQRRPSLIGDHGLILHSWQSTRPDDCTCCTWRCAW